MTAKKYQTTAEQITNDSILKVGEVVSVKGRTIQVRVDKAKNVSHLNFNGQVVKNISVGSYIKIRKGFETIVGKIEGEYINENTYTLNSNYQDSREKIDRVLEIKLIGFYDGSDFKKGINELPLIANECYLLNKGEYADIHRFVAKIDVPLEIGVLSNDTSLPISVGVNSLFASHIGIFGNTGSGKSYTLAGLYNRLFLKFSGKEQFQQNAKFYLLDFNGEYINSSVDGNDSVIIDQANKRSFRLSTRRAMDQFPLSSEAVNDELLWTIASEATEKTQAPFIRRALKNNFIESKFATSDALKGLLIDIIVGMATTKNSEFLPTIGNFLKDISKAISHCTDNIEEIEERLVQKIGYFNGTDEFFYNPGQNAQWAFANTPAFKTALENEFSSFNLRINDLNIFSKIYTKILIHFYNEILKGYSNREHLAPMIKRLEKRVEDLAKVIKLETPENALDKILTVISFKDVNIHMRKILPLLICKHLYEKQKISNDRTKYVNFIIDEAHNILSDESQRESEQWKDYRLETFEEIIKEGRKFGVFLTISSQRPSDISSTIVSQLHNYFLHRLINEKDLKAIENTVSYLDKVSFESLPILPTGSCILTGLVSQIPVIIKINEMAKGAEPISDTYKPTDYWGLG